MKRPQLADMVDEFKKFRRDLHIHPELGFEEKRTAQLIVDKLHQYNITVTNDLGGTGVISVIKRGSSNKVIGLRADTDALPIKEDNRFNHASKNFGKMHACGHDGHTSMLLMAAKYLALYGKFDGSVVFVFQPAEEIGQGAKKMIDEGFFSRFTVDAMFGMHNISELPAGHLGIVPGPVSASSIVFEINIQGVGSHAAMPHNGRDPLFTGVQIVNALQGIISREKNPLDLAVLSVTQFNSGEVLNAVPSQATIRGAVRTFDNKVTDLIENRMRLVTQNIANAFDCNATLDFERFCPPTINTTRETKLAVSVMEQVVGQNKVHTNYSPSMISEDFGWFLQNVPGCYGFIGNGLGEHREVPHGDGPCLLHNPSYDFNDNILYTGANYWITLVENYLA